MAVSLPTPPALQAGWACFLDFDGTLVELAVTPDAIRVDAALSPLLTELQRRMAGALAIVTGRALGDLDRWLTLPALPRAGLHGLERRDHAGGEHRHATPPGLRDAVSSAFAPLLAEHPGLLFEDKGSLVAIHYRQAPHLADEVRCQLTDIVDRLGGAVVVQHGKCVAELKPAGVNKGSAVTEFLSESPFIGRLPVFVGDDRSDADAFAVVNARGGLSVAVGHDDLGARYALPDVAAVRAWLAGVV